MTVFTKTIGSEEAFWEDDGYMGWWGYFNYQHSPQAKFTYNPENWELEAEEYGDLPWFRFREMAIPKNAQIISASLNIYVWMAYAGTNLLSGYIYGHDADNPSRPTTWYQRFFNYPHTDAFVSFTDLQAPHKDWMVFDVKDIVQELVNREGWVSGNAMLFYADPDRTIPWERLFSIDFKDASNTIPGEDVNAAFLTIEYASWVRFKANHFQAASFNKGWGSLNWG